MLEQLVVIVEMHTVRGEKDACWKWGRPTKTRPKVTARGDGRQHTHTAARVIVASAHSLRLSDTWVARHKCDNQLCVNPSHLEPGAHRDNSVDMMKRGRHHRAKVDAESVRMIRQDAEDGASLADIGRTFGVTTAAVWSIVNRRTWRWVD